MIGRGILMMLVLGLLAAPALGQKAYENKEYGFSFKPPKDWAGIPLQPGQDVVAAKFATDKKQQSGNFAHTPSLEVYVFVKQSVTGGAEKSQEEQIREALLKARGMTDAASFLERLGEVGTPKVKKSSKKVEYQAYEFVHEVPSTGGGTIGIHYSVYVYRGDNIEVVLQFDSLAERAKKVTGDFDRTAKSFQWIEREQVTLDTTGLSEREIEIQKLLADLPDGWLSMESPKGRYMIVYNGEESFIKEAGRHLESMRDFYETVFPPDEPIEAVSIVRICANRKDYMAYGGREGTGGYWSPSQKELVFFDNKEFNRNEVFSVVSHEAFHQYIYYFYGELSPHSWYNEGHGDFFGGAKMNRNRSKVTKIEPLNYSSYPRLNRIKECIRAGTHIPLKTFMNWSQREYYGFSYGYPQGWSIVYFLRKAKENKVKLKPEWDSILEDYLANLVKARDQLLAENPDTPVSFFTDQIQKQAYELTFAGWSDEDWQEFEEAWIKFYT